MTTVLPTNPIQYQDLIFPVNGNQTDDGGVNPLPAQLLDYIGGYDFVQTIMSGTPLSSCLPPAATPAPQVQPSVKPRELNSRDSFPKLVLPRDGGNSSTSNVAATPPPLPTQLSTVHQLTTVTGPPIVERGPGGYSPPPPPQPQPIINPQPGHGGDSGGAGPTPVPPTPNHGGSGNGGGGAATGHAGSGGATPGNSPGNSNPQPTNNPGSGAGGGVASIIGSHGNGNGGNSGGSGGNGGNGGNSGGNGGNGAGSGNGNPGSSSGGQGGNFAPQNNPPSPSQAGSAAGGGIASIIGGSGGSNPNSGGHAGSSGSAPGSSQPDNGQGGSSGGFSGGKGVSNGGGANGNGGAPPAQSVQIGNTVLPVGAAPTSGSASGSAGSEGSNSGNSGSGSGSGSGGVVIGNSITLAPGQATTINGVPVSLPTSGSALVIGGSSTFQVSPPGGAGSPLAPNPTLQVGGSTVTQAPGGGFVLVPGQTLSPGGPAITVSGSTFSLPAGGSAIVVNGQTSTFPTTAGSTADVLTFGNQQITAQPNGAFILAPGTTLSPGGSALTISGTTYSLPASPSGAAHKSAIVINGQTSMLGASPLANGAGATTGAPDLTLAGHTYTATTISGTPEYVLGPGETLIPGGKALTIGGTTVSLPPLSSGQSIESAVIINDQTSPFPTPTSASTLGSSSGVGNYVATGIGASSAPPGSGAERMLLLDWRCWMSVVAVVGLFLR